MSEHTIAENLTRLTAAKMNIADAITAKGGTVNSNDGFEEFPTDITTIPSGDVGGTSQKTVNFYNYDGTIVESYSAEDFLVLSALPDNPTHTGLIAQGWNWSLADAKAYVTDYGKLDVGQMYNTSDGALRLYIHLEGSRLSPTLCLCVDGTVTVDWGDNSVTETMTGTSVTTLVYLPHTYLTAGDYVISVLPSSGSTIGFAQRDSASTILCKASTDSTDDRRVYLNSLRRVELPNTVASIADYAFKYCNSLAEVTMPSNITDIGSSTFHFCYVLKAIIVPSGVAEIKNYAFQACTSLTVVAIPSSITSIGNYAFGGCRDLTSITMPDGVTSIGNSAFSSCYKLTSIILPRNLISIDNYAFNFCNQLTSVTMSNNVTRIGNSAFSSCGKLASMVLPSSVTSIGDYVFNACYGLTSVTIPDSVTYIGSYAFQNCSALTSIVIPGNISNVGAYTFANCSKITSILLSDTVTTIKNYAFQYCYSLTSLKLPSSLTTLEAYAFYGCYVLASLTIPGSITSIGNNAFYGCSGLEFIRFLRSTPPTVQNVNAFSSISVDCIIYAPALVVNLYMNGTKYPSKSTYTYVGFATYENGITLPITTSDETHTLTWYANINDLEADTNPITLGNGNEVYAKATEI